MLKVRHGKNLDERNKLISKEVGKEKVLDVGCGTALLSNYITPKNNYTGFDLNKKFVEYAKKKGINVEVGDVLKLKNYKKEDVIVICDVLHHIYPREKQFVKKARKFAKHKLIICEPFEERTKGIIGWIKYVGMLFFDSDGINKLSKEQCEWYNEKDLKDFYKGLFQHRKSLKLKKVGSDIIAIYTF